MDKKTWPTLLVEWASENVFIPESKIDKKLFDFITKNLTVEIYHASRLLEEEIADIKSFGLQVTSKNLFTKKLEYARPYLSEKAYSKIQSLTLYNEEWRKNSIYFILGDIPFVKSYWLFDGFLSFWGGEIVSMPKFSRVSIGEPCIVHLSLPCNLIKPTFCSLAECFLLAYKNKFEGVEFRLNQDVHPANVLDIYTPGTMQYNQYPELIKI